MLTRSAHAPLDILVAWPRARLLGAAIADAAWECRPAGLAIAPLAARPGCTAARLSGGEAGVAYRLVHRVTLTDDRTLTRTLDLETAR